MISAIRRRAGVPRAHRWPATVRDASQSFGIEPIRPVTWTNRVHSRTEPELPARRVGIERAEPGAATHRDYVHQQRIHSPSR